MADEKKFLAYDREHTHTTHYRWVNKLPMNRYKNPDYKEEWLSEQCFACQYYVELTGNLGLDWGVCSNSKSPFDARLMFEHDGCEFFSLAEDEEL